MNRNRDFGVLASFVVVVLHASGCASTPAPIGFLSDYSRLEKTGQARMGFVAPELREYDAFIIDPVEYRFTRDKEVITREQKAEIANYFRTSFKHVLREQGYKIVGETGVRVARLRAAITDIKKSKWYLNLHPGSKLSGAGTGGASMEGEIIDSITGEQLAGVIVAGQGSQFELDHFNALDDVEDVIDGWAKTLAGRLDAMRDQVRR